MLPVALRTSSLAVLATLLAAGAAHALTARSILTLRGEAAGDQFGATVASAGDFNGDGYGDYIVGAPFNTANGAASGRAYVYFGGPNADDVADLTLTGGAVGENFGFRVAGGGDFNGDGFSDVLVTSLHGSSNNGRVQLYLGGSSPNSAADLSLAGQAAADSFGFAVCFAGDVNGDNFDDVLVGAPGQDTVGTSSGRGYMFFGGSTLNSVADLRFASRQVGEGMGFAVTGGFDFNADGFDDWVIGAPFRALSGAGVDAGVFYCYLGGAPPDTTVESTLFFSTGSLHCAAGLGRGGDYNADGFDDVVVSSEDGFWSVLLGNVSGSYPASGHSITVPITLVGAGVSLEPPFPVGNAVDLNGDGLDDLLSASAFDQASAPEAALVALGQPAAASTQTFDAALRAESPGEGFASSVDGGGDFDGDGLANFIVGAPLVDDSGADRGRAYIGEVFAFDLTLPVARSVWQAGQPVTVQWAGNDSADVDLSLDGGFSWTRLAAAVGGLDLNRLTFTAPATPTDYAKVRLTITRQESSTRNSDQSDGTFRIVLPPRASRVASLAELTPLGLATGDHLGETVAGIGDFNADGHPDFAVGVPSSDIGFSNAGRTLLFFGGPALDAVPDLELAGDTLNAGFGHGLAPAGDVNGDGYQDLIVGASLRETPGTDAGRAYLFFGGPSPDATADVTYFAEAAADQFGLSVCGIGDMNGDGYDDVAIGAPLNDGASGSAGRAYVYFGARFPDATADLVLSGNSTGANLGQSLAAPGDVDGDGLADLLVGAPVSDTVGTNFGAAFLFRGDRAPDAIPDWFAGGVASNDQFGSAVAAAGDVNGDGFPDLLAGARFNDTGGSAAGRAFVYFGGPVLDATADLVMTGELASDFFGTSVAGAGDVNGDGYADLLASAPGNDLSIGSGGRAYLFFGGPAPNSVPDLVFDGEAVSDALGDAVAGAGDLDLDGFADILIGAINADPNGSGSGKAYLHSFNRYALLAPAGGETWPVGSLQTVRWRGAEPADVSLTVDGGASWQPLASAVGGGEDNGVQLRVPHLPTRFARVRVSANDSAIHGSDTSDSLFTIESSVALLSFTARPSEAGAELAWNSDPGVGPGGLAGWRLYRVAGAGTGNGVRIGPALIVEPRYVDGAARAGDGYRLAAVNGLGEELELGRLTYEPVFTGVRAWPSPLGAGEALRVAFAAPLGGAGLPVSDLDVGVFDVAGRRVATLASGQLAPSPGGLVELIWNGRGVRAGLYFVRARSASARWEADRRVVVVP